MIEIKSDQTDKKIKIEPLSLWHGGLENNRELTWIFISLGNAPLFCCNFIFLNENCFPVDTFWGNTDKESTTSSSSTTGCNTSGCLSIWKLTVLCRFSFFCTPFFSSPSSVSPWLTGRCVWDGTGLRWAWQGEACLLNFPDPTLVSLLDEESTWGLSFGKMPPCCSLFFISSSAAMLVPLEQPTSLFSAFFLSSSGAMSVLLEQPRFLLLPCFQRFILGCLSLSFSSCLFLPDLLHYLFPYLFICGTVKVIQISSIFNSKRINGNSQYHYF